MAEREHNSDKFVVIVPQEVTHRTDGTEVIARVYGPDIETVEEGAEIFEKITGAPMEPLSQKETSKRSFGFTRWNSSWVPQGSQPKDPIAPPKDPKLN